ncbi:hypothetical protein [Methylomonas sp. AM2-LC]|uniref:hypothetical protein n=1 Tax=Methylomonas sp. AM2-LC TaxID=3153301 RepID=UPI003265708E
MSIFKAVRYHKFYLCLIFAALTTACDNQNETPKKPQAFTNLCELITAEMVQSAYNQPVNLQTAEPNECTYTGMGNSAAFITLTTTLLTADTVIEAQEYYQTSVKLSGGLNQILGDVDKMANGKPDPAIAQQANDVNGIGDEAWLKPGSNNPLAVTKIEVRKGVYVLGVGAIGMDSAHIPKFKSLVKNLTDKL